MIIELSTTMADYLENAHNSSKHHFSLDVLTPRELETAIQNQLQLT